MRERHFVLFVPFVVNELLLSTPSTVLTDLTDPPLSFKLMCCARYGTGSDGNRKIVLKGGLKAYGG